MFDVTKKKPAKWVGALILVLILQTPFAFSQEDKPKPKKEDTNIYQQLELFSMVINKVLKGYVDEVTPKTLIYGALKGMLSGLDPHSQFMDPESYKEMKVDTEGQFGGLGIEISMQENILTVISPIAGTPADKAGIKPLDKIIKIDGKSTKNLTLNDAVKTLRGKPGSKVTLTILRQDVNELLDITVTRDIIKIQSVKDAQMVADKIGYVKLTQFQDKTSDELMKALKELDKKGMKALILDMRNNPGGLLNEAVAVSEIFLGDGKLVVSTKGRIPNQNKEYRSSGPAPYPDIVLAVLINKGSASGSEIVAGAIKDWRRGILIGTTSFGKGSVQSVLPLQDGSALRLTTARYYTPSGVSIHDIGVKPDIEIEFQKPEESPKDVKTDKNAVVEDLFDQSAPAEKDNEAKPNSLKPPLLDDNQLIRAIDVVKGIMIYSGKDKPPAVKEPQKEEKKKQKKN